MPQTRRKMDWKKIATLEGFSLHQATRQPTTFSVRWPKSEGKYGSRRFHAASVAAALRQAPFVAGLKVVETKKTITLADAFSQTLRQASRGEKSRHDWRYYVKRFMRWLAANHPDCRYWHLLTRQIVREYLSTYEGLSDTMRRLALQPISQTSGFMHREYGYAHVADRMRIGSKLKTPPKEVYLVDVVAFCDFVREHNPRIEAGVALQGLAGLQLQEATRLTWDRINLEDGLVEISGMVKNEYRKRVIPVADRVIHALRRADTMRPRDPKGMGPLREHVLLSPKGYPFEDWWENYSKEVIAALKKWNPKIPWKPKDLRNCLPTFAVMAGLQNDFWEQYSGRAPRTVYARHYIPRLAAASEGEEDAFARQMDLFRLHVTDHLNRAIENGGKPANVLNLFEQEQGQPADEFKRTAE